MVIRQQVALALESRPGILASLSSSDVLTLAEKPQVGTATQLRSREPTTGNLSPVKRTPGRTDFTCTLPLDLIGSRAPATFPTLTPAPPIRRVLLASGWKETQVGPYYYVTTREHSGTFVPGEIVTWGVADSAEVVGYSRPRAGNVGLLVLTSETGSITDNTLITGSGASNPPTARANGSGVSRNAWRYNLVTRPFATITASHGTWSGLGGVAAGDLLIKVTSGYAEYTAWSPLGVLTAAPVNLGGNNRSFSFINAVFAVQFATGDYFAIKKPDGTIINFGGTAPTVATITQTEGFSASVQHRIDDKRIRTGVGVVGSVGLRAAAGETGVVNFEGSGAFSSSVGGANFSGVTEIDLASIPLFELAAVTVDGKPIPGQNLEFNLGAAVTTPPDYHGPSGLRASQISAREPIWTFDPDLVHPAAFDWDRKLREATSIAFAAQIGWQAANTFLFRSPNCQLIQANDGDRDGIATTNVQLLACGTSGDDEVSILCL